MFDLATAKTRLGIADSSRDAVINTTLAAAKAFAETYCNRKFDLADEVETLVPVRTGVLSLRRYPLVSLASIAQAHNAGNITEWHLDRDAGLVYMHGWHASHEMTVTYRGGYTTLPDDLLVALWRVFDAVWNATPGGGAAVGASGGSGGIQSVTIQDVGTVRWDSSGSGAGSGAGGSGMIDSVAAAILNYYRRELC